MRRDRPSGVRDLINRSQGSIGQKMPSRTGNRKKRRNCDGQNQEKCFKSLFHIFERTGDLHDVGDPGPLHDWDGDDSNGPRRDGPVGLERHPPFCGVSRGLPGDWKLKSSEITRFKPDSTPRVQDLDELACGARAGCLFNELIQITSVLGKGARI